MKKITLLFVVIMLVGFCFGLTASAQKDHVPENLETFTFDRQTPTLDGVIGKGEYSECLEMDGENKAVFFGKVRGNAVFYLAWDDEALYLAAEVKDDTLAVCRDENASVHDHIALLMNPNGILPFYYYGYEIDISPKDDGTVCFSRMNYGLTEACLEGEPITEHVKGISVIEKKSYVLEAKIGWEVITEIPQFASFTPTSAPTSFSLCYSNFQKRADEDGGDYNIGACRYGKNFVNAQDMFVQSFNLELDVTTEKAPSLPFVYIYCGIAGAVAIASVILIVIKTTKKKQG